MKLLLDTHTFLWWAHEPEKLSQKAFEACKDDSNDLMLSVVSVWEMQIKAQLGKLKFSSSLEVLIKKQQELNAFRILPVELKHIFELNKLPEPHKDPFDRLLIAQANSEKAFIISADGVFSNYPVQLIW